MIRLKIFYTLIILLVTNCFVMAQDDNHVCSTTFPTLEWENEFQKLISDFVGKQSNREVSAMAYTIPVVFHIIHSGEDVGTYPNITHEQIMSQIDVLNQDFGGNAHNVADYPANAFVHWAANQALPEANKDNNGRVKIANFNIQFCLATKDALGQSLAEPGIDRINYHTKGWPDPTNFSTQMTFKNYLDNIVKPNSIWDVKKYLNVWITDKSTLLMNGGVSSVPPMSTLPGIPNTATDSTDGIWCYTKSIGSYALFPFGQYFSNNIDGRTLTHEVGHYLGLRHIWGDANCGNDFCGDTPPASAQNGGMPVYPHKAGSCSVPSNHPDGEMFMNFMDYTMGPGKYMFTTDQMIRAQTAMANSPFRNQLGNHDFCSAVSNLNEQKQTTTPIIYPNPASGDVYVNLSGQNLKRIDIYNQTGSFIQSFGTSVFSVEHLPQGIYFFIIHTDKVIFTHKMIKE